VKWDVDSPIRPGERIDPDLYDYAIVQRLSEDLDLDEKRALELVAQVAKVDNRRWLEERLGMVPGEFDAGNDIYVPALHLFYLERGALSKVLLALAQTVHAKSTANDQTREETRRLIHSTLLEGNDPLPQSLPDVLVTLTKKLRDMAGNSGFAASLRRRFLRQERQQLAETLFYLTLSFPPKLASQSALVKAAKELSLTDPMQTAPSDADLADEVDDRAGISRTTATLLLTLAHSLGEREAQLAVTSALSSLENELGLVREGGQVSVTPWQAPLDNSPRQRALQSEANGAQGFALLCFVARATVSLA
jgi:hypothetical protein